ncbi:mitochondrial sodium/calcium exchanger protein-like isoform X1 [Drosophila pseudoobscura]|uniref:Mitochondrial sodium/calcium exchanger protein-like isoform X1 n=2 Tax=Drosophila pseudoobscura pseudoobscura TaxID=46245 RepID=A0A6I8V6P6_DROPS|nr:mitochondrial sodium/calcium exchanger protein isoform X1 [Drosophila pseudoobscura]
MNNSQGTDPFAIRYDQMSCFAIMEYAFEERCALAHKVHECDIVSTLSNYFSLLYCELKIRRRIEELIALFFILVLVLSLMVTISNVVDSHFSPMLKIIAMKMGMSQYIAGTTLVALGNTLPEALANMMPVRSEAPMYSISISNSLTLILVGGGVICYLKPFKMNPHSTMRDLLYLILSCEVLTFLLLRPKTITPRDGIYLIILYVLYLILIFTDLIGQRLTINSLRRQIDEAYQMSASEERNYQIRKMENTLKELEKDHRIRIHQYGNKRRSLSWRGSSEHPSKSSRRISLGFATSYPTGANPEVDFEETRTVLYSSSNSRNRFLFSDFLENLMPIDLERWQFVGYLRRILMILKAPIKLICTLFLPVVDYEIYRHGWCKLLNCIQIITTPLFGITLIHSIMLNEFTGFVIIPQFAYARWSLCITVPLAIIVFVHSRTDIPPVYHSMFLGLNAGGCLLIMGICAAELEILCCIAGLIVYLSEGFVAVTFRSMAGSIDDTIVVVSLALEGYEQLALGAILGAPIFNILVSMGLAILLQETVRHGTAWFLIGKHGMNCYIFLNVAVISMLFWTLTFNYIARRSAGVFSFLLYLIFIIFAACVEWNVVHEFSKDLHVDPK